MKINWGTGIILAFISFITFIMYFVVNMNINEKYDHDLVSKDYYQQELEYQSDIDKEKNAKNLTQDLSYKKTKNGLVIIFPKELDIKNINGKMFLYRPSDKSLDFEMQISLSNHNMLIPEKRLLDGRWNIKIDWAYNKESYLYKEKIVY